MIFNVNKKSSANLPCMVLLSRGYLLICLVLLQAYELLSQAQEFKLIAEKTRVQFDEDIKFKLVPENLAELSAYKFTFNFGDNETAFKGRGTSEIIHKYKKPGNYKVTVTVSNPQDDVNIPKVTNSINVQVENILLYVEPENSEAGQRVSLSTRLRTKNSNLRYRFNFGDSSSTDWGADQRVYHIYKSPGIYYAKAEIGAADGSFITPLAKSITKEIKVNLSQTITLIKDKEQVLIGESVDFKAPTNRDEEGLEYLFNFNDGTGIHRRTSNTITHSFTQARDYKVSVELAAGGKSLQIRAETVVKVSQITIDLTADKKDAVPGDTITLMAVTNYRRSNIEYWFNFGDRLREIKSNNQKVLFPVQEVGPMNLRVQLVQQNRILATSPVLTINSHTPTIQIKVNKPRVFPGEAVVLSASTDQAFPGGEYWFKTGDNNKIKRVKQPRITYVYTHPGNFNPSVELFYKGRSLSKSETSINVISGSINLTVNKPEAYTNEKIKFTASTNIILNNSKYVFRFEGISYKHEDSTIEYSFPEAGLYTVSVHRVLNGSIQPDSAVVEVKIVSAESVTLSADIFKPTVGDTVRFTASASNPKSGLEYYFFIDNKKGPIRSLNNSLKYVYPDTGKFYVYAKIFFNGQEIAQSKRLQIIITPDNDLPWLYIAAAFIAVSAGYKIKFKPVNFS